MHIASASSVVKFHEFPSNQLVHTYHPKSKTQGPCRSISWSKDGNWLSVVPYSGSTEIISLKGQCKLLYTVDQVLEPSCASFPNLSKRHIAIGTKNGQVLLYDIKSRNTKMKFPRTSSAITHVGYTAKDTHCYAGCGSGEVLLFNTVAKNLACSLKVPKSNSLTTLNAHITKRNFLIAGSNEGIVCVWDVNGNKVKFQTEAHSGPVTSAIFSPTNSALIVSSGLDRLVRVFDIETRSRITTIPVENNILSLDFLEDSLYIAMGAQNGKIHIYDTRNLQDPVSFYEAHTSAIKHLTYQNDTDGNVSANSSINSMVADEPATKSGKSNEEVLASKKRTSDFFGILTQAQTSINESLNEAKQVQLSMDGGDSFMQALGLDKSNLTEPDSVPTAVKSRQSINSYTPVQVRNSAHDRLLIHDSKQSSQVTSTPNVPSDNVLSAISPIVNVNQNKTPNVFSTASITEIQNATKDVVQGEVKKALDDMETKICYKFMDHAHLIRRMILDLHMGTLKEFIKMEDYFNVIRDELNNEPASIREQYLLEENASLKRRIQELENQVAKLTARDDNGN